jgi:hypothetical protein
MILSNQPRRIRMDDRRVAIARRAQELAESGEFEGFNALGGMLTDEFGAVAVDVLRRDLELKRVITDRCQQAWERKHSKQAVPCEQGGFGTP